MIDQTTGNRGAAEIGVVSGVRRCVTIDNGEAVALDVDFGRVAGSLNIEIVGIFVGVVVGNRYTRSAETLSAGIEVDGERRRAARGNRRSGLHGDGEVSRVRACDLHFWR